jgi:YVTN family beta-propeller protein
MDNTYSLYVKSAAGGTLFMNRAVTAGVLALAVAHPWAALAQRRPPTHNTSIALFRNDTRLLVVNRDANSVTILGVRKGKKDIASKIAETAVGFEPRCVALGVKEKEAFVANAASGTVSVIALTGSQANQVVAEIKVGNEPRGCASTPNGKRLFVTNFTDGTVSVIDTRKHQVVGTVPVGGNPWAVAVTSDGDRNDDDETVFVSQFFAELIPNGPGEGFDDGKQAVVQSLASTGIGAVGRTTLSPIAIAGFTADRSKFCTKLNPAAHSDIFCPDTTITDPADPKIAKDPQGAFPNQVHALLVRGTQVLVPSIGAGPEPPDVFNVNVQALVHTIDRASLQEVPALTVNLNNQIKTETEPNPAQGSLARAFGNDIIALDATRDGSKVLIVSRGGNFVLLANRDANGNFDIGAPANVVRFQTGNIPDGIVISKDARRAYVDNQVGLSVSVLDLTSNTVLTRDLPSSTPPEPGTFAHAVEVGKLVFHTALGTPDNDLSGLQIRDIDPVQFRGKASVDAWSSCASCHPDGLADGVTWIFATGVRNTIPIDDFFSKRNPADQRISNWSGIQGSITDFNNNSRNVQGGVGFAGSPPNPNIFNHGFTQGASEALDLETTWVQTIRSLNRPQASFGNARDIFQANCASCHGGAKWTKSQTIYLNNPTFDRNPTLAGAVKFDPGLTNQGLEIVSYSVGGAFLQLRENVGTFDPANPLEIRDNGAIALGGKGFNVPSLLGVGHSAPYFHDGSAPTLDDVFARHKLGSGTIATSVAGLADLKAFLDTIDGSTDTFASDTDIFRDALVP